MLILGFFKQYPIFIEKQVFSRDVCIFPVDFSQVGCYDTKLDQYEENRDIIPYRNPDRIIVTIVTAGSP